MRGITVAEILKMHGKWMKSSDFVILVSEKLGVTQREAYNKIKTAWKKKEILKLPLPDRSVIYGLPDFGPPKTEDGNYYFKDIYREWILKKIDEIVNLASDFLTQEFAYDRMLMLIAALPQPLKDKLLPLMKQVNRDVKDGKTNYYTATWTLLNALSKELVFE